MQLKKIGKVFYVQVSSKQNYMTTTLSKAFELLGTRKLTVKHDTTAHNALKPLMYCTKCGYVEAQRATQCVKCNTRLVYSIESRMTVEVITPTPEYLELIQHLKQEQIQDKKFREAHTTTLLCDICGLSMGRVYESDLNGSYFYHTECLTKKDLEEVADLERALEQDKEWREQ